MTSTEERSGWTFIGLAAAITIPALVLRAGALSLPVHFETILFGVAILGSAFLLSWGAEVAQMDISQALAIAFLAFIAVLPEYAVDLAFAWKAGRNPEFRHYAVANMTGANRLLIGLGWAAVVLIWGWRSGEKGVSLGERRRTELGFLLLATMWAFSIPFRKNLSLLDFVVLGTMFVAYLWRAAHQESEEPELVGPPVAIAALPVARRRTVTIVLFAFAAGVILASAEPFAHGLVLTGEKFGINKFLLVQWLAPLASEAPEMIIAILFVLRSQPGPGLGTLVSSKVNQWTLLIATLPLVYTLSRGGLHQLTLDARQNEEVLLTAAQSVFAIGVLANLEISRWEAVGLLTLFLAQFGFPSRTVRLFFALVYVLLFLGMVAASRPARAGLVAALRDALRPPWRAKAE